MVNTTLVPQSLPHSLGKRIRKPMCSIMLRFLVLPDSTVEEGGSKGAGLGDQKSVLS